MISFSGKVKKELSSVKRTYPEKCAELIGFLLFCDEYTSEKAEHSTESEFAVERISYLFKKIFSLETEPYISVGMGKKTRYSFKLSDKELLKTVRKKLFEEFLPEAEEKKPLWGAFFSGAFLAAGYISNPEKEYYAEIRIQRDEIVERLLEGFAELEILVRVSHRDEGNFFYFKTSSDVSELLFAVGAKQSSFEYLNKDIEKKIRNDVNRARNCDLANAKKQAITAEKQLKAAKALKKKGFSGVSEELIETATARIEHPDMTVEQLGRSLSTPISKAGVVYRFKKIENLVKDSDK